MTVVSQVAELFAIYNSILIWCR